MNDQIDTLLSEQRRFPPPPGFAARAAATESLYEAGRDWKKFWEQQARELDWIAPWSRVLEWELPHARWFVDGKLNASANCLDRHLDGPRRNKAAIVWEGETGERRVLTYWDLAREVRRCANALKNLGIRRGDRVAIYLPMIPEAVVAMLACARIGAVHSVVFGGFSAESLRDRINDAQAIALITADGGYRRGQVLPLKRFADEALAQCPSIRHCVVVARVGAESGASMQERRDHWWHSLLERASSTSEPEAMDAEDLLFILYTSGTTGKPKGIVHTTGGYLTQVAATTRYVFDLKEEDVFWCTADIGWVTGHSYVVYGPLANGATVVMYEGAPDWPQRDRFWSIVETYGVTVLYTAPTAIRAFMKWGTDHPARHDLSTLRLLGSVGEPINPEAWMWYYEVIGGGRCPIVDTWWQTETGGIMITPLPGAIPQKPGSGTLPFFGVDPAIVDEQGEEVPPNVGGKLIIRRPWPSMLRTIYGDAERYENQYWSEFPGRYLTGDGARRDEDGYFWIVGRIDDVLNVAGHRLGTSEIESALVSHAKVAEAAVVGRPDELKGQGVVAFVTLKGGVDPHPELKRELRDHVGQHIGAIAKPDEVRFAEALPKTRSGKIMRRLLKEIASGKTVTGDTTTLEDFSVLAKLSESEE